MIEKISGTDWIEMDIEYDGEYAVMKFFLWKNGKPLTESVELTGEEL